MEKAVMWCIQQEGAGMATLGEQSQLFIPRHLLVYIVLPMLLLK